MYMLSLSISGQSLLNFETMDSTMLLEIILLRQIFLSLKIKILSINNGSFMTNAQCLSFDEFVLQNSLFNSRTIKTLNLTIV